jgi:ATP-dependent DNA ligase
MFNPNGLAQNAEAPKKGVDPLKALAGDAGLQTMAAYVMEPKFDGWRVLAHIEKDGVALYTRTATNKTGFLPGIEVALSDTFPAGTWVDGEVVILNDDGTHNWGNVQSILGSNKAKAAAKSGKATYVIFDCLAYNGIDIRPLPLSERRKVLDTHLSDPWEDDGHIYLSIPSQRVPSRLVYDDYLARGFEGGMLKRKDAPYASGQRGKGWIKLKANDLADVVVMGYKPGQDSFAGMIGAIEFGQYREADFCPQCVDDPAGQRWLCRNRPHLMVLMHRGRCSGMDMATRKDITANQDQYMNRVFSAAYMGIMPSGSLRHPQFKTWRDDKPAEDCAWTA